MATKPYNTQGKKLPYVPEVIDEETKKFREEKKTVPGQSYTVKELIALNKRGISPDLLRQTIYEMDMFGEELNPLRKPGFDLTDMDRIQAEVKQFHEKILLQKKRDKQLKLEQERKAIIDQFIKENDIDLDGILDKKNP